MDQLGAPQKIGPLHWAAHKEHVEIALFLIESGADLLKVDGEGRTPLSMASPELAEKMIGTFMIGILPSSPDPFPKVHNKDSVEDLFRRGGGAPSLKLV